MREREGVSIRWRSDCTNVRPSLMLFINMSPKSQNNENELSQKLVPGPLNKVGGRLTTLAAHSLRLHWKDAMHLPNPRRHLSLTGLGVHFKIKILHILKKL